MGIPCTFESEGSGIPLPARRMPLWQLKLCHNLCQWMDSPCVLCSGWKEVAKSTELSLSNTPSLPKKLTLLLQCCANTDKSFITSCSGRQRKLKSALKILNRYSRKYSSFSCSHIILNWRMAIPTAASNRNNGDINNSNSNLKVSKHVH